MKALAIARSNLTRFLRERSNIFFVFVLPIAIVILVGAQFGDGGETRLGVVSDGDPLSEAIVDDLGEVVRFDGRDELVLAVERGAVDAGVIFPDRFESQVVGGEDPTVVFLARTGGVGSQLRSVVDSVVAKRSVEALAVRFSTQRGASVEAAREAVAAAMLVGSFFENDQQAGAIGVIGGIGLAALGGAMVPRELFSDTMQTVSLFTPHGWAARGFSDLVIHDGTVADVVDEMAVLLAMAAAGMAVASLKLRRVLTR